MASYKINFGRVRGCPDAKTLAERMAAFGMPATEEFGVLNQSATSTTCFATLIRKTQVAVKTLDASTGDVVTSCLEKITMIPMAITPAIERLDVYSGTGSAIEQVGIFLSSGLALKTVTEKRELDVMEAVEHLAGEKSKFQLRTVKVTDFAANAYMTGGYGPKFIDTQHGLDFLKEYQAGIVSATVRYQGPTGRVTLTLRPDACIGYSCTEDDQTAVQVTIRGLVDPVQRLANLGGSCTSMTLTMGDKSVTIGQADAAAIRQPLEGCAR